jgi:hypothetical protein
VTSVTTPTTCHHKLFSIPSWHLCKWGGSGGHCTQLMEFGSQTRARKPNGSRCLKVLNRSSPGDRRRPEARLWLRRLPSLPRSQSSGRHRGQAGGDAHWRGGAVGQVRRGAAGQSTGAQAPAAVPIRVQRLRDLLHQRPRPCSTEQAGVQFSPARNSRGMGRAACAAPRSVQGTTATGRGAAVESSGASDP